MSTFCRMADVAAAASVSVATVSNVINTPHLVKAATRERVMTVIAELGYQRNEQAYLLRSGSPRRPAIGVSTRPGAPAVPPTLGTSGVAPVTEEPETLEDQSGVTAPTSPASAGLKAEDDPAPVLLPAAPEPGRPREQGTEDWLKLPEGSRVLLVDSREETGAVIDAVMPNGSAFWAWLDGGNGRRLIHRGDGVRVLASFESLGATDQ
jgi:hypothetical protein